MKASLKAILFPVCALLLVTLLNAGCNTGDNEHNDYGHNDYPSEYHDYHHDYYPRHGGRIVEVYESGPYIFREVYYLENGNYMYWDYYPDYTYYYHCTCDR